VPAQALWLSCQAVLGLRQNFMAWVGPRAIWPSILYGVNIFNRGKSIHSIRGRCILKKTEADVHCF
jgi:hypothetical protein